MAIKVQQRGFGWAWEFQPERGGPWILCNWAQPHKSMLLNDKFSQPSFDARIVRVELVPTAKKVRERYGYS